MNDDDRKPSLTLIRYAAAEPIRRGRLVVTRDDDTDGPPPPDGRVPVWEAPPPVPAGMGVMGFAAADYETGEIVEIVRVGQVRS